MAGRNPRTLRQARAIKVSSPYEDEPLQEVYSRYSRQQYERRREVFEDLYPERNYDKETEWGRQGGRPKKYPDEKTRKKTERATKKASVKLAAGQPLTKKERGLLGLIKPRPGARKYHPERTADPKERKAKWKATRKS